MSATARFIESVQETKTRQVLKPHQLSPVEVALDDAKRRARSGEWEDAKAATLVGLYALCHQMVYGVVPSELKQVGLFRAATRMAKRMMHEYFDDDPSQVVELIRWSWEREKRKNTWAQSHAIDRNRLSWKWQFAASMETDYRIARTQKRY